MSETREDGMRDSFGPSEWKTHLGPFAGLYHTFASGVDGLLRDMTAEQLQTLIGETFAPTSTNCWYAFYRVREHVRERAQVHLTWKQVEEKGGTP